VKNPQAGPSGIVVTSVKVAEGFTSSFPEQKTSDIGSIVRAANARADIAEGKYRKGGCAMSCSGKIGTCVICNGEDGVHHERAHELYERWQASEQAREQIQTKLTVETLFTTHLHTDLERCREEFRLALNQRDASWKMQHEAEPQCAAMRNCANCRFVNCNMTCDIDDTTVEPSLVCDSWEAPIGIEIRANRILAEPDATPRRCPACSANIPLNVPECQMCGEGVAQQGFEKELTNLINRHSLENASNTPDHILAAYVMSCLGAFNASSLAREKWYGTSLSINGPEGVKA
jgi:hypothetical protein